MDCKELRTFGNLVRTRAELRRVTAGLDAIPVGMTDRAARRANRDWRAFVIECLDPVEAGARWWDWLRWEEHGQELELGLIPTWPPYMGGHPCPFDSVSQMCASACLGVWLGKRSFGSWRRSSAGVLSYLAGRGPLEGGHPLVCTADPLMGSMKHSSN
jgi:hypothetical protein